MPARFAPTFRPALSALASWMRGPAGRERRFAHAGMEHAAYLRITGVTAAGENHAAARPDIHGLAPLVDIAVSPIALQQLAGFRMIARRIARTDTEDAARKGLFPHELFERAVQHEADAFLPRRELERPRERRAVAERVRPDDTPAVVHLHRCKGARALGVGVTRIQNSLRSMLSSCGVLARPCSSTRREANSGCSESSSSPG